MSCIGQNSRVEMTYVGSWRRRKGRREGRGKEVGTEGKEEERRGERDGGRSKARRTRSKAKDGWATYLR